MTCFAIEMDKKFTTYGDYNLLTDVKIYLRRPVVYFCFGIPLFIPSVLLILLASIQGLEPFFIALGAIFLTFALSAIVMGVVMGYRDKQKTNRIRHNKCVSSLEKSTDGLSNPQISRSSSNQTIGMSSSSTPSLLASSSPSLKSSCKNNNTLVTILSNTDKSKIVKLKKKSDRRKRGMRFPVEPLPSLKEEDSFVKPLSRGNSHGQIQVNSTPARSTELHQGAVKGDNINNLKDYLTVLGFGGGSHEYKPQHVDIERRCKSFEEKDLTRGMLNVHKREMPVTSRDVPVSPGRDFPRLVTASHERTGVRCPDLR